MDSFTSIINSVNRDWRFLIPFQKRIGYIGWLGYGNLGDEAMHLAFQQLFSPLNILPFRYIKKIKFIEKIEKRKFFDAIFLGGGTLINADYLNKFRIAQKKYNPTFVFGTGVRDPAFWDRFSKSKSYSLGSWVESLKSSAFVGVRGPLSEKILRDNGFNGAQIIGDPALFLARDKIKRKKRMKRIGINISLSASKLCWGDDANSILNFIVILCKAMIQKGWQITFIPMEQTDIEYIKDAARKLGKRVSILYQCSSLKKTMESLEDCDLFLGEKLHSVILAMCVYTPSVMLEYRPKCLDFMMSMDLEKFNMRTDKLSLEVTLGLLEELNEKIEFFQDIIFQKINYYKQLQQNKRDIILKTIFSQDAELLRCQQ